MSTCGFVDGGLTKRNDDLDRIKEGTNERILLVIPQECVHKYIEIYLYKHL